MNSLKYKAVYWRQIHIAKWLARRTAAWFIRVRTPATRPPQKVVYTRAIDSETKVIPNASDNDR